MHLRVLRTHSFDERQAETRNHRRRHSKDHRAGKRLHLTMHGLPQILELPQDGLRACIENAARGSRRDARHGPIEELYLQLVFEDRELLAQRRLRHAAERGGARDAPAIHNLHEVAEPATVHAAHHKSCL